MKRNEFFDFLKGICIILVIITHCFNTDLVVRHTYGFAFHVDMSVPLFMIMTGYLYSASFERNGVKSISNGYEHSLVTKRLASYLIPFSLIWAAECVIEICQGGFSLHEIVKAYLCGGLGPGSYYTPILVQTVFLFPILYFIIKKAPNRGLLVCFVINFLYEIIVRTYDVGLDCYRLTVFRYIFIMSVGIYCYFKIDNIRNKYFFFFGLIGLTFLIAVNYLGYKTIILTSWLNTSLIGVLYVIPIFGWLYHFLKDKKFGPITIVGKASFDIFLVQMIYYKFFSDIPEKLTSSTPLLLVIHIIVCVAVGIILYHVEKPVTKKITGIAVKVVEKLYVLTNRMDK